MEYPRMIRQLQEIVKRTHKGKCRIRQMDIEAIKDVLDTLDEDIPNGKPQIGFQIRQES